MAYPLQRGHRRLGGSMIQRATTDRYLEVGDKLVRRGKFTTAVAAYSRFADRCVGETCMNLARDVVQRDPVAALKALATAERLIGPTEEGLLLSAEAYRKLGQERIAERFRRAVDDDAS